MVAADDAINKTSNNHQIKLRSGSNKSFWIEMGSLFRDIAAALPAYNEMPTDDVARPRPNE